MNPIEALSAASGHWRGINTLQDPVTGKPEESSSTVSMMPVLGGHFVRLDYTWGYQGKPQEDSMIVGFDPKSGEVSGYWIDTWHMGRKDMDLKGLASEGTITIKGAYPAPPGPDWGWKIEIANVPLRITHTNIDGDGQEDLAADCIYTRQ